MWWNSPSFQCTVLKIWTNTSIQVASTIIDIQNRVSLCPQISPCLSYTSWLSARSHGDHWSIICPYRSTFSRMSRTLTILWGWLLSLCKVHVVFIHLVRIRSAHSSLLLSNIPSLGVYPYVFFIPRLRYYAIKVHMMFLCEEINVSSHLGKQWGMGFGDRMVNVCLISQETEKRLFKRAISLFIPINDVCESSAQQFCQCWVWSL